MAVETVLRAARRDAPLIVAPTQFAVTDAEILRLDLWTHPFRTWPLDVRVYEMTARHLKPDGTDQVNLQRAVPTVNGTKHTEYLELEAGALQTVTLRYAGGDISTAPGITYGKVDLIRGTRTGAQTVIATLLAGYVGPGQSLTWPGSPIQAPLDGPGYHVFGGAAGPGPGSDLASAFALTHVVHRIRSVTVTLDTDATAANRRVRLFFEDAAGTATGLWSACMDVTANQIVQLSWFPGATYNTGVAGSDAAAPMPDGIVLRFGDKICTDTINLQAGDDFDLVQYTADAYLEPLP